MTVNEFIDSHIEIEYCEIIILKDGTIEYAIPGHIYKLIEISGEDKEQLELKMPMSAGQVEWMVDYTNTIAIWYSFAIACENITEEQMNTLYNLQKSGSISSCFRVKQCYEMDRCKKLATFQIDKIKKHNVFIL